MSTRSASPVRESAPSAPIGGPRLQRKCACGNHSVGGSACSECAQQKRLQRKAGSAFRGAETASIEHVEPSGGQPLESTIRSWMESRFDHDFSRVRVHTGPEAEGAANLLGARAYTLGSDVVFGRSQFAPASASGRHLLAHELTHVVQQEGVRYAGGTVRIDAPHSRAEQEADATADAITRGGSAATAMATAASPVLSRACLSDAECKAGSEGSLTTFVKKVESKPENVSKVARRKAACGKTPPDPTCTGDGHGKVATDLTALFAERAPERLRFIDGGIHIDKDIPSDYGAYTSNCSSFTPPLAGTMCTFVPERFEQQASDFKNPATPTIGGRPRQDWLSVALMIITHETEHARFDTAPAMAKPSASACDFATVQSDLSELAAIISSFAVVIRRSNAKPLAEREPILQRWFDWNVQRSGESIAGNLKAVRCACECGDANAYITKTVDFATSGWNTNEKFRLHYELTQPKWRLSWPISVPAVDVMDLPQVTPTIDVRDLPVK